MSNPEHPEQDEAVRDDQVLRQVDVLWSTFSSLLTPEQRGAWERIYAEVYEWMLDKAATPPPAAPPALDVPDEIVRRAIHQVLCMGAKHRSSFTGECRAAPNITRVIRYEMAERLSPDQEEASDG